MDCQDNFLNSLGTDKYSLINRELEYFRTDFHTSRLLSSEPISAIYSVLSQVSGNAEELEGNPQSS